MRLPIVPRFWRVVPLACGLVLACAVRGETGGAQPEPPVSWTLDNAKDVVLEKGWGEVAREGERVFRAALKGQTSVLRVPNWWNGTVRPPLGARYVIEVTFKDVAAAPVSVTAFGGIGSDEDRTELHRIGGANDGQWKVAFVPASWDLLMLRKGSPLAELAFQASADLPIHKLQVREAKLPDDRERWESETRAWVAQVQAEKALKSGFVGKDQPPDIPDAFKGQPLVPYVRAYYDQVQPNAAPQKGEAGATLHVRMARNEYEPGAFAVYAQEDLAGVRFRLSDLVSTDGKKLACEASLLAAEYALEKTKARGEDFSYVWQPQRLWAAYPVSIKKGRSGWFYFVVHTLGEKSLPGTYAGKVSIVAGAQHGELPVSVEVLPITLLTMQEAGLRMGGCVTGYATEGEMQTMLEHNHNTINIWFAGVKPGMKMAGEKLELDFYYMDDFMQRANERGQKTMVWFLGGNPNGYPETLTIERELYTAAHGGGRPARDEFFQKQGTPEARGKIQPEVAVLYKQWIREVAAHAKEKGWPELIFTPFDEPAKWAYTDPKPEKRKYAIGCGPWIRDHFKAACALIHEAAPGNKVYISLHHNDTRNVHGYRGRIGEIFFSDVDLVCTNAIDEDENLGHKVRKLGKDFWQYAGSAGRRFTYGPYFGTWDSRGSLCWAYNWGKRFDLTDGANWEYAWYSPFETVTTPNYEEMREGWDDRRYLETAKAAAKKAGQDLAPLLEQLHKEVLANLGTGGRDKVEDFWEEGRDANKMDLWRKRLADKIMELAPKALAEPAGR